jgi:CBS-domain-containing membrane protein
MSNKTSSSKQSLMKASDVMTSRVVSVRADASIMTAIRLMLQNHISGLPVTGSAGELLGIDPVGWNSSSDPAARPTSMSTPAAARSQR